MGLIKGTHHVSLKCNGVEQYDRCVKYYTEVLGMEILRCWGPDGKTGCMLDTGNSILEIFGTGSVSEETGAVNHFALATDDVDACVEASINYGLKVKIEPGNVTIPCKVPFPLRRAFVIGPVGEEIEFFAELSE